MRIALMIIRKLYLIPYLAFCLVKSAKLYKGDYLPGFKISKKIAKHAIQAGNIDAEIIGLENIPEESGFILYPNHQGLFDTLMFFSSSPQPFACVIKKEASKIFFLRKVVEATGSLAMDRDDLKQSLGIINQVAKEVKTGRNYLIFAEGTRSHNANNLLDFKGGSFKAAQKAKCPIVPCALINSFIPFDESSIRQVKVTLEYLPPLVYEDYKNWNTNEIAQEVKRRIEQTIKKYV